VQSSYIRFAPVELPESGRIRLNRLYPRTVVKENVRTILVPRPTTAPVGGQPLRDEALLAWVREVVDQVIDRPAPPAAAS
jgi:transcription-repair coupling factor (superfamily II helicase)